MRFFARAKLLWILLLLGALVYWQYPRILVGIGRFLVREDRPAAADLIVCLSGSWIDRTLAAADLYRAGWSRKVFLFRAQRPDGYDLLERRGIHLPEAPELAREVLIRCGVPPGAIVSPEREATSTYEEALIMRDFLKAHPSSRLILVTSKYHSTRAYLTFRSALDDLKVRIRSCPTPYDPFDPQRWWQQEALPEIVFLEYQKLLASLLRGRIKASLLVRGG